MDTEKCTPLCSIERVDGDDNPLAGINITEQISL